MSSVDQEVQSDAERFHAISKSLLANAGGAHNLFRAAVALGVKPTDLHGQITNGEILGMAYEGETIVPLIQFSNPENPEKILDGIPEVLAQFREAQAGYWSALQFLAEHDPLLGDVPVDILRRGGDNARASVVHAARAFLSLDEG